MIDYIIIRLTYHHNPADPYEPPMNGKQQIMMGTAKSIMI